MSLSWYIWREGDSMYLSFTRFESCEVELSLSLPLVVGELQIRPELDQRSGLDPSRLPQGRARPPGCWAGICRGGHHWRGHRKVPAHDDDGERTRKMDSRHLLWICVYTTQCACRQECSRRKGDLILGRVTWFTEHAVIAASCTEGIIQFNESHKMLGPWRLPTLPPLLQCPCVQVLKMRYFSFRRISSSRWRKSSSIRLQSRWRRARRSNRASTWTPWKCFTSRGRRPFRRCRKSPPPPRPRSSPWRRSPAPPRPPRRPLSTTPWGRLCRPVKLLR